MMSPERMNLLKSTGEAEAAFVNAQMKRWEKAIYYADSADGSKHLKGLVALFIALHESRANEKAIQVNREIFRNYSDQQIDNELASFQWYSSDLKKLLQLKKG
jgi:hypothetical protein